jgi:hypothetical protein
MKNYLNSSIQRAMFSESLNGLLKKPTNRHERRIMAKLKIKSGK